MEDVSHMTGENKYRRPPKNIQLNEVRFNGKEGTFKLINLLDRKEGEKAEEEDLGSAIQMVILKFRRRLAGYNSATESFYTSTEHNTKNDVVYMFGAREKGVASELQEKFKTQGLKIQAQRVVYAYLLREKKPKELVRFIVKGTTLNTQREGKNEEHMDFFTYTQREKPKSDHIYTYVTDVYSGEEKGKLGKYYTLYFKPGPKLADEQVAQCVEEIKKLHGIAIEQDNYYEVAKVEAVQNDLPSVEYPTEEIDPADIPF